MIVQLTSTSTDLFALDSEGRIWHYVSGGWEEVPGPPVAKPIYACSCEAASLTVRQRLAGERCGFCNCTISP